MAKNRPEQTNPPNPVQTQTPQSIVIQCALPELGGAAGKTGADLFRTESVFTTPVGGTQFVSDQNTDGEATEIDTALGNDSRTGWEEERNAFLTSKIQFPQAVSAGMGVAHGVDRGVDVGGVVSSVVQLGRRMEQAQSHAPVIDSTTRRFRGDSKQLRKEQEKKIALGHKEDDHEDDIDYSMRLTM